LIAHAYNDPQVRIGVILGTGTNAAYVEQATRIPKYKGPIPNSGEMIINIEWGAFDNEKVVLPVTKYDIMLDRETPNPGWQTFEKMISGLYLGEIVRHALIDLIDHAELFQGHGSQIISQPYSFETSYMSRIERYHSHRHSLVGQTA
jgi:hexokinase